MAIIVKKKASGAVGKEAPVPALSPLEAYCTQLKAFTQPVPLVPADLAQVVELIAAPIDGLDPDTICAWSKTPCHWGMCTQVAAPGQASLVFQGAGKTWPQSYMTTAATPWIAIVLCMLRAFADGVFIPQAPAKD